MTWESVDSRFRGNDILNCLRGKDNLNWLCGNERRAIWTSIPAHAGAIVAASLSFREEIYFETGSLSLHKMEGDCCGAIAGLETDNGVQPVPSSETGINPP